MSDKEQWFAIRCVFDHGTLADPKASHTYEERVILVQSETIDEAIREAEADAEKYAEDVNAKYIGLAQAFHMYDPPKHGAEVFSLMRDSDLEAELYINTFFDTGKERQR